MALSSALLVRAPQEVFLGAATTICWNEVSHNSGYTVAHQALYIIQAP